MQIGMLMAVKYRVMDELRWSVQANQVYRDKVKIFHKFPYKEREMQGIVLRNASANRVKLSADDHAGTLKSYLGLARAENCEGNFLSWVWEDRVHTTSYVTDEDLSSQITGSATYGTNRVFYTQYKPIVSGPGNTISADNFRQVEIKLNGQITFAEYLNGTKGMFMLPMPPVVGDTLTISYYYNMMSPPGRYYLEIVSDTQFIIDPLYIIKGEQVIVRTLGTETNAQLVHGDLYGNFDKLYTKKYSNSEALVLVRGTDYTVTVGGYITFLQPLLVGTTLYADYRWAGDRMGPFDLPKHFHYINTALPGVILSFSNQFTVGDKMVVLIYPQREPAAQVFSGHYNMTFEIDVFTRDPQTLADLTDHLINDVWNNRRLKLMDEGLTITEMEPGGESEDVYDTNTNDLYYKNSVTLQIMSEWKKFVPYLYALEDYSYDLHTVTSQEKEYTITNQNQMYERRLIPFSKPFEVKYPTQAYPRYF